MPPQIANITVRIYCQLKSFTFKAIKASRESAILERNNSPCHVIMHAFLYGVDGTAE